MNRLNEEKSAYLQQHKDNPVHWLAYGKEALKKAQDENKPIFLSIGYSTCHWCHVMAHESFENQEVADFLNQNFIAIKVDKEEFPDLDNYYQQACQLFTGRGGWPLSAFLLPDLRPFYVGTYFPIQRKAGSQVTTFPELIKELHRAFHHDKEMVEKNASESYSALLKGPIPEGKVEFEGHFPTPMSIMNALKNYRDEEFGGFGQAPKFPQFAFYEWACEQLLDGMISKELGEHVVMTLERMLMGGISDHARGGIHRYSTDEKWMVPHFEKMLYDQAGYLKVLSKLSLLYPSPLVFDALLNTLDYLSKEMRSDQKYFFSAQDADSEGVEGLYFTFSQEEFEDILTKHIFQDKDDPSLDIEKLKSWFQISSAGNFEQGLNVISLNYDKRSEIFTEEGWPLVRQVRNSLLEERKRRLPPATDTKGVASWNFMLISSLCDVIQYCRIEPIKKMASTLLKDALEGSYSSFVMGRDENKSVIRHTTTKEKSLPYLEDYVFFAQAQLRAYELTANPVFKDNLAGILKYIQEEFIENDKVLTRTKSSNDQEAYPNQEYFPYDTSFRSAAATLVEVTRRASTLFADSSLLAPIEKYMERLKHDCLKNPVAASEALRALTYPKEAYRVVKVPRAWAQDNRYIDFISYFMPRFVFDYHEDKGDVWEICSLSACEMTGEGLEHFIKTLSPKGKKK